MVINPFLKNLRIKSNVILLLAVFPDGKSIFYTKFENCFSLECDHSA
jgi:hypothetical protein